MFTKKQARGLAKGFRARGLPVPAKIRRKLKNPGTKAGARKARRKGRRKVLRRRRSQAKSYRKAARGYKVVVRRKAGRRKSNKRFQHKTGIRTGRKGTISFRAGRGRGRSGTKLVATNPRRRRRSTRHNPALSAKTWQKGLTNLPQNLGGIFKGKDMMPNIGYAAGGALGSIAVGNLVRGAIFGAVGNVAPGVADNRLVQGVLGAAVTYSSGYAIGTLVIKNDRRRTAFITGAATAAIVNALMPGQVNRLFTSIPVVGPMIQNIPGMNGLGAYVDAPSYQAVGTYVDAPSYQAVGDLGMYSNSKDMLPGMGAYAPGDAVAGIGYNDDALAGELGTYVESPGYQAVGDIGMYASSFLD